MSQHLDQRIQDLPNVDLSDGLCASGRIATSRFFPPVGSTAETWDEAKALCAGCPVKTDCLRWAVAAGPHGVFAGTDPWERDVLRKEQGLTSRAWEKWTGEPRPMNAAQRAEQARQLARPGRQAPDADLDLVLVVEVPDERLDRRHLAYAASDVIDMDEFLCLVEDVR